MSEQEFYYMDLSAEDIEDRILHMVPYNKFVSLTSAEKAVFRKNIDAGENNTGFIVLGYFSTLEDMKESLDKLPSPGDAYGIGLAPPYDIYVYDGYHQTWVNNGPLNPGDTVFLDSDVSTSKGWTSSKISSELAKKQSTLQYDSVPTANSNKMVTSGSIFNYSEKKKLVFTGIIVQPRLFSLDSTYENYPYKATLDLTGVTASMIPVVIYNMNDATSGILSPVAETKAGSISLYASEVPSNDITIPAIMFLYT